MNINLLSKAYGKVTARGITFKGNRFTCSKGIREQWFEQAAFNRAWRIVVYFTYESDAIIYIADDSGGLEECRQIDTINVYSDVKLQQYFQSIQNLMALRKSQLHNNRVYKNSFFAV